MKNLKALNILIVAIITSMAFVSCSHMEPEKVIEGTWNIQKATEQMTDAETDEVLMEQSEYFFEDRLQEDQMQLRIKAKDAADKYSFEVYAYNPDDKQFVLGEALDATITKEEIFLTDGHNEMTYAIEKLTNKNLTISLTQDDKDDTGKLVHFIMRMEFNKQK